MSRQTQLEAALHSWVSEAAPKLCSPGQGSTWERFVAFGKAAGQDLALGRLGEGHADALSILEEANRRPLGRGPYGVWAARGAGAEVTATPTDLGWRLDGRKGFCSGAGMLERALVTAEAPDGTRLFDVDVTSKQVTPELASWPAVGMAASASAAVTFEGVSVTADHCVGPSGFYTERIGFWWGAAGVAACWWGGAQALLETVGLHLQTGSAGPHELASYGSAMARARSMTETLRWAASEIDADDHDIERARRIALTARDVVHEGCTAILGTAAAAGGARPICLDVAQSQRSADLYAYLAQHHGGRDAAALGTVLLRAARLDP